MSSNDSFIAFALFLDELRKDLTHLHKLAVQYDIMMSFTVGKTISKLEDNNFDIYDDIYNMIIKTPETHPLWYQINSIYMNIKDNTGC